MLMSSFNRRQKLTVIVFAVANFCSAICVSLQAPFYPQEAEKKGATATQYGFVFGIFELMVFIVSPIIGKNLSRLGAKRVFNAGIMTTGICSILFGLLDQIEDKTAFIVLSFIIRSVEAIGNSGFLTASFSIIAQEFPEKVATMFASMETCFGLGLIVGPSVGGALYQAGGYVLPFAVMGLLLIMAASLTFFVLPSHYDQGSTNERAEKGLCAVLMVPTIAMSSFSVFCASISLGFLQTTLEPHMRRFNLSPLTMGAMFVVNGGTYAIAAPIWGWLCDKVLDPRLATAIGAANIIIGFMFLGPVPILPFTANFYVCISSLIVHGVGFAAALVSGFALAHREAVAVGFPDNLNTYALISSLWTSIFALGAFIGPSVAGVLVDNFSFEWSCMMVVVVATSVLFVSVGFLCCKAPTPRLKPAKPSSGIEDDEAKPLLEMNDHEGYGADGDHEHDGPEILSPSQVPERGDEQHRGERARITQVPRSRGIFSPFVSPMESMGMMSMMGCSVTAASQTNSMVGYNGDENEIIVDPMVQLRPARRGESLRRLPRSARNEPNLDTSRDSKRTSPTKSLNDSGRSFDSPNRNRSDESLLRGLDNSRVTDLESIRSSDKDSPNRIQVRALVEDDRRSRTIFDEENTIS